MTEQAAKLTVKVKLHAAQPVVLPSKAPPARLSKLKVTLGLLLLVLITVGGYWLWQQLTSQHPQAVTASPSDETSSKETSSKETSSAEVSSEQISSKQTTSAEAAAPAPEAAPQLTPAQPAELPVQAVAIATAPQTPMTQQATSAKVSPEQTASSSEQNISERPSTQNVAAVLAVTQNSEPVPATASSVANRALPEGFSRIVLSATMERLEPGVAIDSLVAQQQIQRLYLFTELTGYAGQQLIHRWSYAGEVKTEALLTVEDSPWRTYSENWLLPDQLGNWRVEIIDQQQKVLYQHDFQYQ